MKRKPVNDYAEQIQDYVDSTGLIGEPMAPAGLIGVDLSPADLTGAERRPPMAATITWTPAQQARLLDCLRDGNTLAYYCSDDEGRPANGGSGTVAIPGATHHPADPDFAPCTAGAVHGTREPHRWDGRRVWVVALRGIVHRCDVIAATEREIIGEVTPTDCIDPRIAVRIGVHLDRLAGADLTGADLSYADLSGADLTGANLTCAILRGANLREANLREANLRGADLDGAHLDGADLDDGE